jgi:hypothetical protein
MGNYGPATKSKPNWTVTLVPGAISVLIPPDLNSVPEIVPSNELLEKVGKTGRDAGGDGNEHVTGAVAVTSPGFSTMERVYLPLSLTERLKLLCGNVFRSRLSVALAVQTPAAESSMDEKSTLREPLVSV